MSRICIYGAASDRIEQKYKDAVYELGTELAAHNHELVFGAGSTGLMGAAARGITDAGGHTIGVAPEWMNSFEPIFQCTETILVDTMAERKLLMEERADAFVIVPGGVGTMDEFFQILTLKELNQLDNKPIVLYNVDGFYNELDATIHSMSDKKFLRPGTISLYEIASTPEEVIQKAEIGIRKNKEAESLMAHPMLQEPGISQRVLPVAIERLQDSGFHATDAVLLLRNVLDYVQQDLLAYKNHAYDECVMALPSTTYEEFMAENEKNLTEEFFNNADIKSLVDWEIEQDNQYQINEMNEAEEEAYEATW